MSPRDPWQEQAICAQTDPELFFPEGGSGSRQAKMTCLHCPVRLDCLHHAIANSEYNGVWGGLTDKERRAFKLGRRDDTIRCMNNHDLAEVGLDNAGNCQRCAQLRGLRDSQRQRDRRKLA